MAGTPINPYTPTGEFRRLSRGSARICTLVAPAALILRVFCGFSGFYCPPRLCAVTRRRVFGKTT